MQPTTLMAIGTLCLLAAANSASGAGSDINNNRQRHSLKRRSVELNAGASDVPECRLSPRQLSRAVTSLYRSFLAYLESQGEAALEELGAVKRGPAKRKDKYVWRL